MLKRSRLSLPLVAATTVAVMVLGGGAAIAKPFFTGADIKDESLTGQDIKNGSLTDQDLNPATVAGLKGKTGRTGKTGAQGLAGAAGKDGVAGTTGTTGPAGAAGAAGAAGSAGAQGPQGPQGVPGKDGMLTVTSAAGGWNGSNSSVAFSNTGVKFGPYTDSSSEGGSLVFTGLSGLRLKDIAELSYSAGFLGANDGNQPYLRIFIHNGAVNHDVIFSPSTQPNAATNTAGRLMKYDVHEGTVRYDDDGGNSSDVSWNSVLGAHGDEVVDTVKISAGFAFANMTDAFVNSFRYEVAGKAPTTVSFSQ